MLLYFPTLMTIAELIKVKVWHEGIIHKLQHKEILGNLLSLLTNFLKDPKSCS